MDYFLSFAFWPAFSLPIGFSALWGSMARISLPIPASLFLHLPIMASYSCLLIFPWPKYLACISFMEPLMRSFSWRREAFLLAARLPFLNLAPRTAAEASTIAEITMRRMFVLRSESVFSHVPASIALSREADRKSTRLNSSHGY